MVLITAIQALNSLYDKNYFDCSRAHELLERLPNGTPRYYECFNHIKKITLRINKVNMRIRAIETKNNIAALNRNTASILLR